MHCRNNDSRNTETMMGVLILMQCRILGGSVRKIMKTAKTGSDKMKEFSW